jgi:pilus assembly protein FimV
LLKDKTVDKRLKSNSAGNLTKTLALLSLLAPVNGNSLGIGDIKLHSTLNQNLDAEISLVLSAGDKASDITVNLASPDKFDEAGIPWTAFLSEIKFEKIIGSNGSVIIKLSSRKAVKEPYLDFVLQVNWPKGSLHREFTVLLDPPIAYKPTAISRLANSESYKPVQSFIPRSESQTRVEKSLSRSREYGPTNRNDNLWKVAEQASKKSGTSVEQMIIALYEENPHAFYKQNVNALLAGKTLTIPEKGIVLRLSKDQALAEFNRQTKAWKNQLEPASIEIESAKKEKPDNQLTLVAPTEADIDKNAILTPEIERLTAKKEVDDSSAEPKKTDEAVTGVNPLVNDTLQDKVSELEKQLVLMQQILALKDQQLAALQDQGQVLTKPVKTNPGQNAAINPVIQQSAQLETKPVIQSPPQVTSSANFYYLLGGGSVISLLGWLWWRKRKLDKQADIQDFFATSSMNNTAESKGFISIATEKDNSKIADGVVKGSVFGGFALKDFETFDTDQGDIDPVAEADVYLAYGRYQQAEELMLDVIKDQPNRDECKLKLLKIYFLNKDKHAFETYAIELAKAGKNNDIEFWAKVTEMGNEISNDSSLFSNRVEVSPSEENIFFDKKTVSLVELQGIEKNDEGDTRENNSSLPSFGNSFDYEEVKKSPHRIDNALNSNFLSLEDEVTNEPQNNESIDFDLSMDVTKAEESVEILDALVTKKQNIGVNDVFDSFNFDSSEAEIKESTINETVEHLQPTHILNEELSSLNSSFTDDSLERNFYFNKPVSELNGEEFDHQGGFDVFDLTDMDELETKLDLAKAYIDMSDIDAAKDIASEVLEKGNAEQKKVAQALLNDLK